jgi:hypothetical protein
MLRATPRVSRRLLISSTRRHSTLGYVSPAQFLQDWMTTQHERKTAA